MGGKASSTQKTSTSVSTNTTTSVGDIGLTGKDAIELANVLEAGSIQSETLRAKQSEALYQGVGTAYNNLIAGAGNFLVHQSDANRESLHEGLAFASDTLTKQLQSNRDTLSTAASLSGSARPVFDSVGFGNATPQEKTMLLLAAAGVAVTIIAVMKK